MKFILSSCIFDMIFLSGVLYCHSHAAVMEQIGSVKLHCPLELQRQGKGKQNFSGCSGHEYLLLYPPIPAAPSEPATQSTWGRQVFPPEAEQFNAGPPGHTYASSEVKKCQHQPKSQKCLTQADLNLQEQCFHLLSSVYEP